MYRELSKKLHPDVGGYIEVDRPATLTKTFNNEYPPVYIYTPTPRKLRDTCLGVVIDWIDAWASGGTHTGVQAFAVGGWGGGEPIGQFGKAGLAAGTTVKIHRNYLGGLTHRSTSGWPSFLQTLTPGSALAVSAVAIGGTPASIRVAVGFHLEVP